MDRPFYVTWSQQDNPLTLSLDGVEDHFFLFKDKKWVNLSSLSYQSHFGLRNKTILKAMEKQLSGITLASPKHIFPLKEKVSQELLERVPFSGYKVFYTLSGSEGIENALKMARQVSGREIIVSLNNSYHGATMGALSVTGDWRHQNHLLPLEWSLKVPMPADDPQGKELENIIESYGPSKIGAFCLETITGGNGVFIPPKSWYKKVQTLCKKHGILLILDEVVCGAHRTGPFFGFEHYSNLRPDFIVMAKGITGGYFPMGCVLTSKAIAKYYDKNTLSCGLTNYAHPIGLATIEAVLKITKTNRFQDCKLKNEETLKDWLKKYKKNHRVVGSLACLEDHGLEQRDLYNNGIYAPIQAGRIILAPPLTMPTKVLKEGLKKLEDLL